MNSLSISHLIEAIPNIPKLTCQFSIESLGLDCWSVLSIHAEVIDKIVYSDLLNSTNNNINFPLSYPYNLMPFLFES